MTYIPVQAPAPRKKTEKEKNTLKIIGIIFLCLLVPVVLLAVMSAFIESEPEAIDAPGAFSDITYERIKDANTHDESFKSFVGRRVQWPAEISKADCTESDCDIELKAYGESQLSPSIFAELDTASWEALRIGNQSVINHVVITGVIGEIESAMFDPDVMLFDAEISTEGTDVYTRYFYRQANLLWSELIELRNKAGFHREGYTINTEGGNWNEDRKTLLKLWRELSIITPLQRYEYGFEEALLNMSYIGRDWYRNEGQNTKNGTAPKIKQIEAELKRYK